MTALPKPETQFGHGVYRTQGGHTAIVAKTKVFRMEGALPRWILCGATVVDGVYHLTAWEMTGRHLNGAPDLELTKEAV